MCPKDEDWIAITREWLEEQMPAHTVDDEAAYVRFRLMLEEMD